MALSLLKTFMPFRKLNIGKVDIFLKNRNLSASTRPIGSDSEPQLPFDIYVAVDYRRIQEYRFFFEVFIAIVPNPIAICFALIGRQNVRSITRLTERLSKVTRIPLFDIASSEDFESTMPMIKWARCSVPRRPKIREYHAQLELKRNSIAQGCVRPHFYLNMLSMIHSMLQNGEL